MRKNEAGLTILETGDVVRIGKGKVEYSVEYGETAGMLHVKSLNTGKSVAVERERLTLVQSAQELAVPHTELASALETEEVAAEKFAQEMAIPDQTPKGTEPISDEAWGNGPDSSAEEQVQETSAYAKAVLFALNKLQKHVYAGTVRKNGKSRRRALNGRQKASRKANR